ncbi:MAG TPA: hypothetical protein DCQ64_14065 [Candidatus Rokubacteria bacterium]|nr:hypothetical protein [Candidatus Rokubacteria bacterium]
MRSVPRKQVDLDGMRDFRKDDTRDALNALSVGEIVNLIGAPDEYTEYASVSGWSEGDGRPTLASEDPAVMQAIGRCLASRVRSVLPPIRTLGDAAHPSACDWCDYPQAELTKACSWSVWHSHFVIADVLEWQGKEGSRYARPGTVTGYQNPDWRRFYTLGPHERERRIAAATGRPA